MTDYLEEIKLADGRIVRMGNLIPEEDKTKFKWPTFGDVSEQRLIPQSEWEDHCLPLEMLPELDLPPTAYQNGIGMCNASATCTAAEAQRKVQGLAYQELSGGFLYSLISGGVDQGSMLEDGLAESMRTGLATTKTQPYLTWRGQKAGAVEEAKGFRVLEAYRCPTFAHCFSAVAQKFSLISGVLWYNNFEPDREGWLPVRGSGRPGGHAVFGFAAAKRNGNYGIYHQNSWGQWGYQGKGWCIFPSEYYSSRSIGGWWAIRSITDEGGNLPQPIGV